jgi:DNA-binding MarR family transcriptional regulator
VRDLDRSDHGRFETTVEANDLGITKQAAGQLVDELVGRGYLRRTTDEQDRRRKLIVLTAQGEDCLRQIRGDPRRDPRRVGAGGRDAATARRRRSRCARSWRPISDGQGLRPVG